VNWIKADGSQMRDTKHASGLIVGQRRKKRMFGG
jgi:hypothetical protein